MPLFFFKSALTSLRMAAWRADEPRIAWPQWPTPVLSQAVKLGFRNLMYNL
jgi:hypothetical protein